MPQAMVTVKCAYKQRCAQCNKDTDDYVVIYNPNKSESMVFYIHDGNTQACKATTVYESMTTLRTCVI